MICIWCVNSFLKLSLEHVIPEALACPPDLEMHNIACEGCNSKLGHVDNGLVKQFEAVSVILGVPRKEGKPPTIDSWRAISSKHNTDGPHIFINGGPGTVSVGGKNLYPAAKSNGITDLWIRPEEGKFGFGMQFGNDPRFLRALYKIGLSLVGKHFGPTVAAGAAYNHVRAFVGGVKTAPVLTAILMKEIVPQPVSSASGPILKDGYAYPMFRVGILGATFVLDLDPNQPGLRDMCGVATLMGEALYMFPRKCAA